MPRRRFWIGESIWAKSWKIAPWNSGAMPMPVSRTEKVISSTPSGPAPTTALTRTSPCAVNFSALEM